MEERARQQARLPLAVFHPNHTQHRLRLFLSLPVSELFSLHPILSISPCFCGARPLLCVFFPPPVRSILCALFLGRQTCLDVSSDSLTICQRPQRSNIQSNLADARNVRWGTSLTPRLDRGAPFRDKPVDRSISPVLWDTQNDEMHITHALSSSTKRDPLSASASPKESSTQTPASRSTPPPASGDPGVFR